jgi:hypothetical protein
MLYPVTIVRCNPGQHRGTLRGFTITQRWQDHADVYSIIATSGRKAIEQMRGLIEQRAAHKESA